MATLAPSARSRRRHGPDPRLLIGLGLVLAAVAGVVGIVSVADTTVPVYAAAAPLAPGDRIAASDLVERHVILDGADRLYVPIGGLPAVGAIVTRAVSDGELLPASAIGDVAGDRQTAVVLPLAGSLSSAVEPGAVVDVWSATPARGTSGPDAAAGPPVVLATGALVIRIVDDEGLVASNDTVSVEVLIPRARVARILQSQADGDSLSLVPTSVPIEAGG